MLNTFLTVSEYSYPSNDIFNYVPNIMINFKYLEDGTVFHLHYVPYQELEFCQGLE